MDLTVTRRRKRSAVDPCLGYYEKPFDKAVSGITLFSEGASSSRSAPNALGRRADPLHSVALSDDPGLVSNAPEGTRQVTVNDFLSGIGIQEPRQWKERDSYKTRTRLAQAPASFALSQNGIHEGRAAGDAKNLRLDLLDQRSRDMDDEEGHVGSRTDLELEGSCSPTSQGNNLHLRNRRAVRRIVLSDSENDSSSSKDSSRKSLSPLQQSASLRRRKKRGKTSSRKAGPKKSFGTRLFEASVATHGQPLDSLVVPPVSENDKRDPLTIVQPLPFVPLEVGSSGEARHNLNRKATLVDPRKATPFSNASFFSTSRDEGHLRHGSEDNTTYDKLTNWKTRVVYGSEAYSSSASPVVGRRQSQDNKAGGRPKQRTAFRNFTQREDYPALDLVSMGEVMAAHHGTKGKEKGNR